MGLPLLCLPDRMLWRVVSAALGLVALASLGFGLAMAAGYVPTPPASERNVLPWLLGGAVALVAMVVVWAARPLYSGTASVTSTAPLDSMRRRAHPVLPGASPNGAAVASAAAGQPPAPLRMRIPGETSLRSYKVALDDAPAAIMITDTDARIEYVNDAFLAYSGYSREELIGQNPRIFGSGRTSTAVYRSLWQTLCAGEKWRGEFHNRRKDGTEYWEQMAISPLRDEFGQVSHFMAVRQDITETKQREGRLRRLARIDPLTGVSNRRRLMELAEREWQRATRLAQPLAALMVDIDRFKRINDEHGHAAGDRAICIVARTCVEAVREIDVVGRYGGEEFVVLLPATDVEGAREVAERLRLRIAALRLEVGPKGTALLEMSASIGVAALNPGDTLENLLASADAALYRAKSGGRNRTVAVTDPFEDFDSLVP